MFIELNDGSENGSFPIFEGSIPSSLLILNKQSWIYVFDSTNIKWVRIFHLYKGFHRKVTYPGYFVKGSARVVKPPRVEYKGFKYRYNLKGDICRLWLIKSNKLRLYRDSSSIHLLGSGGFVIKKKSDPKSKYLKGPICRNIKRRRFKTLFKTSL